MNKTTEALEEDLVGEEAECRFHLIHPVRGNYLVGTYFGERIGEDISDFVGDNFEDWS